MQSAASGRQSEFGPYDLCEHLGHGGITTVVRAIERDSGRVVVLKRLQPQFSTDAGHIRQFLREARLAQALDHPNIVKVYDVGQVAGVHYMSMEWIPGNALRTLLDQRPSASPIPVVISIWILREILRALDYVTTGVDDNSRPLGIVHRDISPSNVIITPDGEVKVIDFGCAKSVAGQYATNSGVAKGELGYMAPETMAGAPVEGRSDLYSLAILAWELLANRRLFGGSAQEQLDKRDTHQFVAPSSLGRGIPAELDDLLAIAMEEDPSARWPSAAAMASVLDVVIRRYGTEVGRDAWIRWTHPSMAMRTNRKRPITPTSLTNLGVITTLPAPGGRKRGRYRFGPNPKTVVDPKFDPGERHRQLAANDE